MKDEENSKPEIAYPPIGKNPKSKITRTRKGENPKSC
jgi:hypothetical protein